MTYISQLPILHLTANHGSFEALLSVVKSNTNTSQIEDQLVPNSKEHDMKLHNV